MDIKIIRLIQVTAVLLIFFVIGFLEIAYDWIRKVELADLLLLFIYVKLWEYKGLFARRK